AFDRFPRQPVEMRVARRNVTEERRDADHWPVEILVEEADATEHGPVGSAAGTAGSEEAMAFGVGWHDAFSRGGITKCKLQNENWQFAFCNSLTGCGVGSQA